MLPRQSGVGVLDNTACALFADFQNKGLQDLLVVCAGGPLLFLNRATESSHSSATLSNSRIRPRELSPTPPSPTTIATAARHLFLPLQLLPGPGPVSLSRSLFRRAQWPAKFPVSQPGQRHFRRPNRSRGTERRQQPLQLRLRLGRLQRRRLRPIFTWPTTSAAAISIATTATGHSRRVSTEAGVEDVARA